MQPGSFDVHAHYYARVLNAQMHPIVRTFLGLGNDRIAKRYCHLHPEAAPAAVHEALQKVRLVLQLVWTWLRRMSWVAACVRALSSEACGTEHIGQYQGLIEGWFP